METVGKRVSALFSEKKGSKVRKGTLIRYVGTGRMAYVKFDHYDIEVCCDVESLTF